MNPSATIVAAVAVGGAIGAVSRYALSLAAARLWPEQNLPIGTLAANLIGCLAIGVLAGASLERIDLSPPVRSFLFVGLLGGFTTFSSFGLEAWLLFRENGPGWAALYVAFQVVSGLLAVAGGYALGRLGT
jgi:CrcB protein